MKFKLQAGKEVDVLNQDELKHHLTANTASWFQEMARGMSTARFSAFATVAGGIITLPAAGSPIGPEVGFAWMVQRITADNLAGSDVLTVYRNSVTPTNKLGLISVTSSFHVGSKGALLRSDERLIITGTGLTTTGDVAINGESIEVAESDLYKIL